MKVFDTIMNRKSIRRYRGDPIPEEVLTRILEAARWAPSGKNLQPWKFIVVRDKHLRQELAVASARQSFMAEAPITIVACGFPEESYAHMGRYMKSWSVDVAIAVEHLMLQAQEEGLGTCWIGSFEEEEVKAILRIPEKVRVLALTPLGYPDERPSPGARKPLEDIVSYDSY